MASSSPVQAAVELMGWRHLFHIIALMTLAVAVIIFVVVPERRAAGEPKNLADQLRGLADMRETADDEREQRLESPTGGAQATHLERHLGAEHGGRRSS